MGTTNPASALTGGPDVLDNIHYSATATDGDLIGKRSLFLRRQIVDCTHIRAYLKRWMKIRAVEYLSPEEDLGPIPSEAFDSIWAYCKHCYRYEGCRQFLQLERAGIENLKNEGHTGWLHLQISKRYRNYCHVDSMENYWGR